MIVNNVILYKNFPITGYDNQVYYKSKEDREKAFDKYKSKTFKDVSMIDLSSGTFRTNMTYYVGNLYNYCKIETDERDYYCFVTGVTWQSNNNCTLQFSIDVWQTYVYDVTFKQCLVEREHVEEDYFGDWLADEGLPYYGIKCVKATEKTKTNFDRGLCIAVVDTSIITGDSYIGHPPAFCRLDYGYSPAIIYTEDSFTTNQVIAKYIENNLLDSIVGVYRAYVKDENLNAVSVDGISTYMIKDGAFSSKESVVITMNGTFDGYKPHNQKCLTYPFNFLQISNYQGTQTIYKREEQVNPLTSVSFQVVYPLGEGGNCFTYPVAGSYKNNKSTVLSGATNPEVGFITNPFSAYYSANQNTINNNRQILNDDLQQSRYNNNTQTGTGIANNLIGMGLSGLKGGKNAINGVVSNGLGLFSNLLGGLTRDNNDVYNYSKSLSQMNASLSDIKSKGDTLQGQFSSSLSNYLQVFGFSFNQMQVSRDCIEMIDNYFDMFGYKIAQIKKPQWNSRPYWNYIKTSGANVTGNVPCNILKTFESMLDNGMTIWHDISYMYKYDEYADKNIAPKRSNL